MTEGCRRVTVSHKLGTKSVANFYQDTLIISKLFDV